MARQANKRSFGGIRKLPSGRFQSFYADPNGQIIESKSGKPMTVRHIAPHTFDSRQDAEAWLTDERRLISSGTWTSPQERRQNAAEQEARDSLTFAEYALGGPNRTGWVKGRRNKKGKPLAPSTLDKYHALLEHHLLPYFGSKRLVDITRDDVNRWHDQPYLAEIPTQQGHAYDLLRAIFNTATNEHELLTKSPVYIRGAGKKPSEKQVIPPTMAELDIIVKAMPPHLRMFTLLAAWTGLRSGELRELRRADVKFSKEELADGTVDSYGWLTVKRGVTNVRRERDAADDDGPARRSHVGGPKTEAGKRAVAVPPHLLAPFRQHLLEHAAPGASGLLFPARRSGGNMRESSFWGRRAKLDKSGKIIRSGWGFHEARRLAGRDDLTFHDLRHLSASMAGEQGATTAELMHRLGHSTATMAQHYQHASRSRDRDLARRMSQMAERGGHLFVVEDSTETPGDATSA